MEALLISKMDKFKDCIKPLEEAIMIQTCRLPRHTARTIEYGKIKQFEIATQLLWEALTEFMLIYGRVKCKTVKKTLAKYRDYDLCNTFIYEMMYELYEMSEKFDLIKDEEYFNSIHEYVINNRTIFSTIYDVIMYMNG